MIPERCAIINLTLIILLSCFSLQAVNGAETFTTEPVATANIGNAKSSSQTVDHLIVYTIEHGIKKMAYFAFNLSDIPNEATPIFSTFKIECAAISEICHISTFCFSGADWIGKNVTWETRPNVGNYVNSKWIDTMKDWYAYDGDSLNDAVKEALAGDHFITISLRTGIGDSTQYGIIGFYPDAILEINYIVTEENSSPNRETSSVADPSEISAISSSGGFEFFSTLVLILFLLAVIVVALAFIVKRLR